MWRSEGRRQTVNNIYGGTDTDTDGQQRPDVGDRRRVCWLLAAAAAADSGSVSEVESAAAGGDVPGHQNSSPLRNGPHSLTALHNNQWCRNTWNLV